MSVITEVAALIAPLASDQTWFSVVVPLIVALGGGTAVYSYFTIKSQNERNTAEAHSLDSQAAKTDVDRAQGLVAINERTLANVEHELKRQDRELRELRETIQDLKRELEERDAQLVEADDRMEVLRKRLFEVLTKLDLLHDENISLRHQIAEARAQAVRAREQVAKVPPDTS